jgi:hypothetical protein
MKGSLTKAQWRQLDGQLRLWEVQTRSALEVINGGSVQDINLLSYLKFSPSALRPEHCSGALPKKASADTNGEYFWSMPNIDFDMGLTVVIGAFTTFRYLNLTCARDMFEGTSSSYSLDRALLRERKDVIVFNVYING